MGISFRGTSWSDKGHTAASIDVGAPLIENGAIPRASEGYAKEMGHRNGSAELVVWWSGLGNGGGKTKLATVQGYAGKTGTLSCYYGSFTATLVSVVPELVTNNALVIRASFVLLTQS